MKKMTGFLTVLAAAAVLTGTILSVSAEAAHRKIINDNDGLCVISTVADRGNEENGKRKKYSNNMLAISAAASEDKEARNGGRRTGKSAALKADREEHNDDRQRAISAVAGEESGEKDGTAKRGAFIVSFAADEENVGKDASGKKKSKLRIVSTAIDKGDKKYGDDKLFAISTAAEEDAGIKDGTRIVSFSANEDEEQKNDKVCAVSAAVDKNNKGKIDNIAFKAVSKHRNDKSRIRNLGTRAARLSGKNNHNDRDSRTYIKALSTCM